MTDTIATKRRDRHGFRRPYVIGALVLAMSLLPVTGLAEPAITRADEPCAPGWV